MVSEAGVWDPATVLGIKSSDKVLVIGNAAFLPWLAPIFEQYEHNLVSAKRNSELEYLLHENEHFDKVILARETPFSNDHVLRAAAFKAQLIYFPQDDGWQFEQSVEFYYPGVRVWKFDTTFGPAVMAEPYGASWRIIHG
jgi:hypothetical protein